MKIKIDQFIGLLLIFVGIFFAVLTHQLPKDITAEYPGPKLFPYIAVFGLIVCGTGIFVQGTLRKENSKELFKVLTKAGWIRCGLTFIVLVIYTLILKYIDFLIASPILIFVLTTMFAKGEKTKLLSRILFAVILTGIIYILYTQFFGYKLP